MAEGFSGNPVQLSAMSTLRGHAHGLRGPVLLGSIRWPDKARWPAAALAQLLVSEGGLKAADAQRLLEGTIDVSAFLAIVFALEQAAHTPVTQAGVSLAQTRGSGAWVEHALALPSSHPPFTHAALTWLASVFNLVHRGLPAQQLPAASKAVHEQLGRAREELRSRQKVIGINTARIARACGELGLPCQVSERGVLQAGSGRNARIFISTFTESTLAIGTSLALSKSLTASMLGARGMPVPAHRQVASADEAVAAAQALGFPVVVKPDNRDGGRGVHAGLTTEAQVRRCFAQALSVSPKVLLEKHVEGKDFRITVDGGRVVKAIGRRPGGVTGDGRSSVAQLVAAQAAAQAAARGAGSVVSLDAEAVDLLAERGMTAQDVPRDGDFIALRRRANMSTGGTSRDVLAAMHPDNARLAVRAAQALRLDVAGVDLIIPDIGVSWLEGGAAICEVNAQPQISTEFAPDVYRDMLRRMVREPVRLHTVLVIGASDPALADAEVTAAAEGLRRRAERVLAVRSDGRWLDGERIARPAGNAFMAAMASELELDASAAVAALTPQQLLRSGVPWLHVDEVRVAGAAGADAVAEFRASMALLAPHVVGELAIDEEAAGLLGADLLDRLRTAPR